MRAQLAIPLLAPALLLGSPAFADEPDSDDLPSADQSVGSDAQVAAMAAKLRDPAVQEQAAAMVQVLGQVLLQTPVGPLAAAINDATGSQLAPADERSTLGDLVPGSEKVPERLAENLPQAMDSAGRMAAALDAMKPALREIARHFEQSLAEVRQR